MSWLLLSGAVVSEVVSTLALRVAAGGRRSWYALVIVGYAIAFALLSGSLPAGMPLGVAYGVWAAAGIVLTALLSRLLFREALTPVMMAGMGLIVAGVLLVELGGAG